MTRGVMIVSLAVACATGVAACGEDSQGRAHDDTGLDAITFDSHRGDADGAHGPADFGAPCSDNTQCDSGFCVDGPDGSVCTRVCAEVCPNGWSCRGVTNSSGDVTFLCLPGGHISPDATIGQDADATSGDADGATDTGAADADTGTGGDTVTPPPTGICDPISGADSFRVEASDWPDCLNGCPRDTTSPTAVEVDLVDSGHNGFLGVIDGASHELVTSTAGPDVDVIGVTAPARTMLEIGVFARGGASIDPLVFTSDGFGTLTFNSDAAPDTSCARTTIAFPYTVAVPLWIVVEDGRNYEAAPDYPPGSTVGGSDYGYAVRVRMSPFSPTELGAMSAGDTREVAGEILTEGGETRYYRLTAPGDTPPTVTLTRTGASAFVPGLAGFKTNADQLVWQMSRSDADGDGAVFLPSEAFEGCVPDACSGAPVEYIFAVYDWNGDASPGAFSYDLEVRIP